MWFPARYLMGVLAKVMVDTALFLGKPIALEGLALSKDRLGCQGRGGV
ncbi:MAG: hypothetical protein ACPLPR_06415 [Bacillota bacterium]